MQDLENDGQNENRRAEMQEQCLGSKILCSQKPTDFCKNY